MKTDIKRRDLILNIIITVLFASAVFLFCRAVFFDMDSISGGIERLFASDTQPSGDAFLGDAALLPVSEPLYTLVTPKSGSHYAEKYGKGEKYDIKNMFAAIFGEALGSAGSREQISEAEWQAALKNAGVFLDYVYPQSLAYLSKGLGTTCSDTLKNTVARRFILSIDGDKLYLCFMDEKGGFYRCGTASSASSLSSKISECPIGISQFSFELGDRYKNLDPYFIFTNEDFGVANLSAENPVYSTLASRSLLDCFGINENASTHYTEPDGSTIYVEGDKSLRFDSGGRLIYSVSGGDGIAIAKSGSSPTVDEVLTACGSITRRVFLNFGIGSAFGVTGISVRSAPSECTVSFGQFINGIPVAVNGEAGTATYRISGGSIVYINIILRSYTVSKLSSTVPLPEKQTAAIVNETGGEPVLIYVDDSDASATVSWITFS